MTNWHPAKSSAESAEAETLPTEKDSKFKMDIDAMQAELVAKAGS